MKLPSLPKEDLQLEVIILRETIKRLTKEYRTKVSEVDEIQEKINEELKTVIYINKRLPNLFENSPSEIIPVFNKQNLPRLKALNDNPQKVMLNDLRDAIRKIRRQLKEYKVTTKDLGIDFKFTIDKNENGYPYNKTINKLLLHRGKPSKELIGTQGKVYWLKKDKFIQTFFNKYDIKIIRLFIDKRTIKKK